MEVATEEVRDMKPATKTIVDGFSRGVARAIHERMVAQGLSVDDVQSRLRRLDFQAAKPSVYSWLNGSRSIHVGYLPFFAAALGCTVADITPPIPRDLERKASWRRRAQGSV